MPEPGGYGGDGGGPAEHGFSGDRRSAPPSRPAPAVTKAANQTAIDAAADRATEFNDSVLGIIAGLVGFKQKPSLAAPGAIEGSFSINPVGLVAGAFVPGSSLVVGKLASAVGVPDYEIASFRVDQTTRADPPASIGGARGGQGGGGGDLFGGFGVDYAGSSSFGFQSDQDLAGGADLFGPDGINNTVSPASFDGNGAQRNPTVTAAVRGTGEKEMLAAAIGLAAIALELGG